jgi:putative tryptophan/tyrosine transport system substrate-binding protein
MKWIVAVLATAVFVAGSLEIRAQPAVKVHRIGIVSPLEASPEPPTVRAFRQALRALGHVEGKNVIVDARFAEGRPERFPELFAELIERKVDVLVTGSTLGAVAAKRATATIPIVFAGIFDAAASGIVTSLARPGGNITGATFGAGGSAIAGKWLELLKEAVPALSHAAVLHNSVDPQSADSLREIHGAARALKVRVEPFDASNDATLETAFAAIGASGAQGLIVVGTAYFGGNRVKLIRFAAEKRMPAIYFFSLFPDAGGLMSYGGSSEDSYRRAASHVDRILKGAKPADLPIDQATKYELVINLKTAKALRIVIPRSLLLRADRVIE